MRDQVTSTLQPRLLPPPLPFPRFSCTLGWWLPVLNVKWSWWETFLSPHESCAHPRRSTPSGSAIILRGGRNVFGLTLATPQLTWRRDDLLAARPCASGRERGEGAASCVVGLGRLGLAVVAPMNLPSSQANAMMLRECRRFSCYVKSGQKLSFEPF